MGLLIDEMAMNALAELRAGLTRPLCDQHAREIASLMALAEGLIKTIGELQAINTALIAEVETLRGSSS